MKTRWIIGAVILLVFISGIFFYNTDFDIRILSVPIPQNPTESVSTNTEAPILNTSYTDENSTACSERTNIVFVKTHKTGTSTTVNILYRFGIMRGLNYAVYPYKHQLYTIDVPSLMKLPKTENYNIMCQHMVFEHTRIRSVMPSDTYYFSLLREPFKAFISFFIFYGKDKYITKLVQRNLTLDESINLYLTKVEQYTGGRTHSFLVHSGINSMSYDMGMSHDEIQRVVEKGEISEYIGQLDRIFHFMMILEYLDESLILLQEDLCWGLEDLFYLNRMQSTEHKRSKEPLQDNTIARLQQHLTPDYMLYNHFYAKLKARLAEQSTVFQSNLAEFRSKRKEFEEECLDTSVYIPAIYNTRTHPLTNYGKSSLHCNILSERDTLLTKLLCLLQDSDDDRRQEQLMSGLKISAQKYYNLGAFPRSGRLKA